MLSASTVLTGKEEISIFYHGQSNDGASPYFQSSSSLYPTSNKLISPSLFLVCLVACAWLSWSKTANFVTRSPRQNSLYRMTLWRHRTWPNTQHCDLSKSVLLSEDGTGAEIDESSESHFGSNTPIKLRVPGKLDMWRGFYSYSF